MAKDKKKWILPRHRVIINLLRYPVGLYVWLRYGLAIPKKKDRITEQSLILLNHQTPFDQFFVGLFCKDPVYYMATEDIFSNGWVSKLIKFLVNPIPIKKQTTDIKAVMNCIKVVREGGSIAIAPEGNRTYSGKTEYMNPAIGGLAKKLGLPVVLFRIDGGYGKEPRWSDVIRGGKLKCEIVRTISPEEAKAMTADQMVEAIREGLYVNEAVAGPHFPHKKQAEYIERAIYVCPDCGLSEFESHGDTFHCKTCGKETRYNADKTLTGINWTCPFSFVNDWYEYQKDYVNQLDPMGHTDAPLFQDVATVRKVIVYQRKELLQKDATVALYSDRLVLGNMTLPLEDISTIALLGRNKMNVYYGDDLYQLKSHKRFCALKYCNLFYRIKNILRGDENGKFLGL